MVTALSWTIGSFVFFAALWMLFAVERQRGRLLLAGARAALDDFVLRAERATADGYDYFWRYVIQLGWLYGMHSLLSVLARGIERLRQGVDVVRSQQLRQDEWLRRERRSLSEVDEAGYLNSITAHKAATALTTRQKQQRRKRSLEQF